MKKTTLTNQTLNSSWYVIYILYMLECNVFLSKVV